MLTRIGVVTLCLIYSLSIPTIALSANDNVIVDSIIGGATGAVIGSAVGGRKGALIGAGLGALAGVSVATHEEERPYSGYRHHRYDEDATQVAQGREYSPRHDNNNVVVGGAIGGVAGAAIGSAVGGRKGTLIGAGLGALTGASIATHEEEHPFREYRHHRYDDDAPQMAQRREYSPRHDNNNVVVGGVIGGAAGATIGSAVGGRKGALIGAGLGALTGVSVATHEEEDPYSGYRRHRYYDGGWWQRDR